MKTPRVDGETADGASAPLLALRKIEKSFPLSSDLIRPRSGGVIHAVAGVDLDVAAGETIGLVGETGCGKSTLSRLILRLADPDKGTILFDGQEITALHGSALRAVRPKMQMVFQDPRASLNPRRRVGSIIAEPLIVHRTVPKKRVMGSVKGLMDRVGLRPEHANRYPHEFSGGQLQRVGIARALALQPKLIVCDEPVSALDVSIRAQILNLLKDLQSDYALTYVFISHDLSVVRYVADRIAVMYLGKIVETGTVGEIFKRPRHPYTGVLLSAVPVANPDRAALRKRITLQGEPPSPIAPPSGCAFHPRCPRAQERCKVEDPALHDGGADGHAFACHFPL